jgi:hypothetical protein
MKKVALILIIACFLMVLLPTGTAYCNETKIITHSNQSLASSDYNITITRVCDTNDAMPGVSITVLIFFLSLTVPFFMLPFIEKSKNKILNSVMSGASLIFGFAMLIFVNGIVMHMTDKANLGLAPEFAFMFFLLGKGLYVAMVVTVLMYWFRIVSLIKQRRLGEDE